ncbi:MAG: zinc-binding dehydrogenase [Candidatus Dormibacteria bacterium]
MRAATIVDGELRWQQHPDPVPRDSQLLVQVRAAGVNAADLLQLRGGYPPPPGVARDIPGLEVAGEVIAVGPGVSRFGVGDRVMALLGGGGQAELALLDETAAMAVPASLSWEAAGGFPEVFITAYDALFTQAGLGLGDHVLVTGAAGGVGTAAVQLAALAGATVTASVRTAAMRPELLRLGANQALDPEEALRQGPFDLVLELVGGPSVAASLESLAVGGRIAVIGLAGGRTMELNLASLMGRRARIFGSTLRARSLAEKAIVVGHVTARVLPLLASGQIQVPVMATYGMERAAAAYRRHALGGKLGKIILVPGYRDEEE